MMCCGSDIGWFCDAKRALLGLMAVADAGGFFE